MSRRRNRRSNKPPPPPPPPITAATTEGNIPPWVVQKLAIFLNKEPEQISTSILKNPALLQTLLAAELKVDNDLIANSSPTTTPTALHNNKKSSPQSSPIIKKREESSQFPTRYYHAPTLVSLTGRTRENNPQQSSTTTHALPTPDLQLNPSEEDSDYITSGESDNEPTTGEEFYQSQKLRAASQLDQVYKKACNKRKTTIAARVTYLLQNQARLMDITDFNLGPKGTSALAETLLYAAENGKPHWVGSLQASGNNCGDQGAEALASIIRKSQALEHIVVDRNNFGRPAGCSFAKALSRARPLVSFSAAGNPNGFGSSLLHGLAESDIILSKISRMNLNDTGLTEFDLTSLNTVVQRLRHQLLDMQLGWNCLKDHTFHVLIRTLLHIVDDDDENTEAEGKRSDKNTEPGEGKDELDKKPNDAQHEQKEHHKQKEHHEQKKHHAQKEQQEQKEQHEQKKQPEQKETKPSMIGSSQLTSNTNIHSFIKRLSLHMCSLSDSSGVFMGEFLKLSKSIDYLDISSNDFGLPTAIALASSLEINTSLQIFNVSFNALEIEGTEAIVNACGVNKTLRELWLQNTCWKNEGRTINETDETKGNSNRNSKSTKKRGKNQNKLRQQKQRGNPKNNNKKKTKPTKKQQMDKSLPIEVRFPNWRPAVPMDQEEPFYTEKLQHLKNTALSVVQTREEYLMLSLMYPHEPGMLSLIGTDKIEEEISSSDSEEEEKKQLLNEDEEDYRSAFTWRSLETDSQGYYDTKRIMKRAFESDWAHSNIESMCGNSTDAESVRKMLTKHYRHLHELFRYESAQEDVGNDLRITLNGWCSLIHKTSDSGKTVKDSDLQDIFYQSISSDLDNSTPASSSSRSNKNTRKAKNDEAGPGLWRYQFIEAIVRLAHLKKKNKQPLASSIKMLIEGSIKPKLFQTSHVGTHPGRDFYLDAREFRESRLYYIEVSQAFLNEENKLRRLYKAYAKGDGDFSFHSDFKMSMREWCQLCQACGFTFRKYGLREVDHRLAFVYAQPAKIDPLKSRGQAMTAGHEKSTLAQLSFTDFLEALGRLACMLRNEITPNTVLN